jgi:ubiquinol-cytochrome c reductase cytochrome b subunit
MSKPLLYHPVPPDSNWLYVFGSATLTCFIIQIITGVALSFLYQPSSGAAYESLKYISDKVFFGNFLRGLHYFGASGMILLVGIHMIRVYLMAAFKYPREMSWISGVFLLLLTITMGFTGQLLRWDNTGVWSAVVGAEQAGRVPLFGGAVAKILLGGDTLSGLTINRVFSIHVFLVPAMMFAFIGLHLFLVIRNGISEMPRVGIKVDRNYREWYENMLKEKGVPFWPSAAWRDVIFSIVVFLVIVALALIIGPAPIGNPPNPADIHANPRPDWYFLWIFALFALMPRELESYAIAFAPVVVGLILLLLPIIFNKGEKSPARRPWTIAIVLILVTMVAAFWDKGVQSPWSPAFDTKPLTAEIVGNVSADAKEGADLFYRKACIYCHAIEGHGGERGPDLSDAGHRLDQNKITISIINGGKEMPSFGGILTSAELEKIVSFLMSRK